MTNMTQRKPDSAKPTGEPASAVRSPLHDPGERKSLGLSSKTGSSGLRPRAEKKPEREQMPWLGRGVAGDRRVGSVDEINRETRRDQNGVHGQKTRRAAWRESERP